MYTTKSDVYSYGVLLYEIFSDGATPHAAVPTSEVLRAVEAGERLARPSSETPDAILDLIRACTQLTVAHRPSMASVDKQLSATPLLFVSNPAAAAMVAAARDDRRRPLALQAFEPSEDDLGESVL